MKTAVTGATGFVGGALAKRLLEDGHEVALAGRRLEERVPELIEQGGRPAPFDLLEHDSFPAVVEGAEVLFHVAAWVDTSPEHLAEPLNIDAVEGIVRAAAAAGVRRVVHVSTISVYDLVSRSEISEAVPVDPEQVDLYGATKARGELAGFAAAREAGIEFVAVRPSMVYGPGSVPWTLGMFKLVNSGTPALFGAGDGHINPLYIDNLVDGLVAAATAADVDGEAIHLTDGAVTWADYLGHIGAMCGRKPRHLPVFLGRGLALAAEKLPLGLPLTRVRLDIALNPLVLDMAKAKRLLSYEPRVDLEQGMRQSEAWLREIGKLR